MWPPPAPRSLAEIKRQVDGVGDEIRRQQKALLLALGGEIVRLAGEAVLEVVGRVEDEMDVVIHVDDRRAIGHRDVARRRGAGAVEMPVPGVERDREHRAGLPLERDTIAGVVPHRRRSAAVEHEDHLLVELALRLERAARGNFAHVAVVRGARRFVVDENAVAAAPRPRFELDRAQVRHIMRADDVEAFVAHPAQVGRVLFGGELVRKLVRDDGIPGHASLPWKCFIRSRSSRIAFSNAAEPRHTFPPASARKSCRRPASGATDGHARAR